MTRGLRKELWKSFGFTNHLRMPMRRKTKENKMPKREKDRGWFPVHSSLRHLTFELTDYLLNPTLEQRSSDNCLAIELGMAGLLSRVIGEWEEPKNKRKSVRSGISSEATEVHIFTWYCFKTNWLETLKKSSGDSFYPAQGVALVW